MAETRTSFVALTCQVGAEPAVKRELSRERAAWRFAYSRPGFLTFKLGEGESLDEDFHLKSVFARAYGLALGAIREDSPSARVAAVWDLARGERFDALHVWPRDQLASGEHDFEPGITPGAVEAATQIRAAAPNGAMGERGVGGAATRRGDRVLDVILVQENEWFVARHRAHRVASLWPGGMFDAPLPEHAVSRAYLKMEESIRWSRLPMRRGDVVFELGCAPGGSCQALLDRGLRVTGIDPAEVRAEVLSHANFRHLRKRAADVRRREFHEARWLAADMNVSPDHTLELVEAIITHPAARVRGMLLTLKLHDWKLAEDVPAYLARVSSWGFAWSAARQLHHNRQEICLAALRERK